MNTIKRSLRALLAALPLLAGACAESTAPDATAPQETEVRELLGVNLLSKKAVRWSAGHVDGTYSVSGTIGPKGGTLAIPASDFSITFASGAVKTNTAITITSLSGQWVSYDMRPHGLKFSAPVTVNQGLRRTEAYTNLVIAKTLVGAYVNHDDPPAPDGSFVATELLKSTTSYLLRVIGGLLQPDKSTWQLKHFSRYMLASG